MNNFPEVDTSWLRLQPSLTGDAPLLDVAVIDDDPVSVFRAWIAHAVEAGVAEPHAMTLATLDDDGIPDASTLILKRLDARGWAFAGPRFSRKGAQLAAHPVAALNFWWQPVRRAVRVRGHVVEASAEDIAADLAARSTAARKSVDSEDWVLWWLRAVRVEFWQGETDRRHSRIVFERSGDGWNRVISGRAADTE